MHSDELYHYGIKGMRWGVRRYQNEDGSLTNSGKRRYGRTIAVGIGTAAATAAGYAAYKRLGVRKLAKIANSASAGKYIQNDKMNALATEAKRLRKSVSTGDYWRQGLSIPGMPKVERMETIYDHPVYRNFHDWYRKNSLYGLASRELRNESPKYTELLNRNVGNSKMRTNFVAVPTSSAKKRRSYDYMKYEASKNRALQDRYLRTNKGKRYMG